MCNAILRYERNSSKFYESQLSSTLVCDRNSLPGKFFSGQPRKGNHDPKNSPSFSATWGPTLSHYRSVPAVSLAFEVITQRRLLHVQIDFSLTTTRSYLPPGLLGTSAGSLCRREPSTITCRSKVFDSLTTSRPRRNRKK